MHFDLIFFNLQKVGLKTTKSIWIHVLQIHLSLTSPFIYSRMFPFSLFLSLSHLFTNNVLNHVEVSSRYHSSHCKCPGVEDRLKTVSATVQSALGLTFSLGFDCKAAAWGHEHITNPPIVLEFKGWGQGVSWHGSGEGSLPGLLMAVSCCVLTWEREGKEGRKGNRQKRKRRGRERRRNRREINTCKKGGGKSFEFSYTHWWKTRTIPWGSNPVASSKTFSRSAASPSIPLHWSWVFLWGDRNI